MLMTAEAPGLKKMQPGPKESLLSKKDIPLRERLIFALDVSSTDEAKKLVEKLGDSILFYKLGLQLWMAEGYFELIRWLRERDKKVFVDLKWFEIPEIVRSAVLQLKNKGVSFATVHANEAAMKAAVEEKNGLKILAVTVLTSLDAGDLRDLGFQCDVKTLVLSRAKRALAIGCDGVISSGLEASELRKQHGDNFLIISPGIRPLDNVQDDQKRVATVEKAFLAGADYIVMGRPIRDAADPKAKAEEIQSTIKTLFGK